MGINGEQQLTLTVAQQKELMENFKRGEERRQAQIAEERKLRETKAREKKEAEEGLRAHLGVGTIKVVAQRKSDPSSKAFHRSAEDAALGTQNRFNEAAEIRKSGGNN